MNLLFIDLETTSAEVETARIVEIACCLWNVESRTILGVFSALTQCDENPAQHVNGIDPAALVNATPVDRAFATVGHFVAKADILAAHNGDGFDRPIMERYACPWTHPKPWVDTMEMTYPRTSSSRSLVAIALAHGVPIGTVHRAFDDVLLLARLFERASELGANIPALLEHAMRPKRIFEVASKAFDPEQNARSKAAGFRWDAPTKSWRKKMAPEDCASLGFAVREVA